jgi:hypothetical protein
MLDAFCQWYGSGKMICSWYITKPRTVTYSYLITNKPKPNAYGEMTIGEGVGNICNQSGGTPHTLYPPKAKN